MIVDLDPLDVSDRRDGDRAAPVGQFLEAVLVIQRGVTTPGGVQGRRERFRRGRSNERRADVLAAGLRGVHQLSDPRDQAVRADDDLHLLLREALDVIDGQDEADLVIVGLIVPGQAIAAFRGGEQRLFHRDRMHRVPVDQQRARREMLAGQPQRVGVVPLFRPVVVDQRQPHPVVTLEAGGPVPDYVRRVADHDHDVTQPHRGQVAQGDVQDGDLTVDWQQGFRQLVGVRPQPATRAGR